MRSPLLLLLFSSWICLPAAAMTLNFGVALDAQAANGFLTTLAPDAPLSLSGGLPDNITTLFQQDYPGFSYVNAAAAASGTLTGTLGVFQNGLQGGISINASFVPSTGTSAPHIYDWIQYLTIDPLTSPFQGATSSPFTDPPPDQRDDNLPFYWTTLQRMTPGLGYSAGGNINDDPLFSDVARVNDARSPVQVRLYLYLADFDSSLSTVTIYDGLEYGFDTGAVPSIPEPGTWLTILSGLTTLIAIRRHSD